GRSGLERAGVEARVRRKAKQQTKEPPRPALPGRAIKGQQIRLRLRAENINQAHQTRDVCWLTKIRSVFCLIFFKVFLSSKKIFSAFSRSAARKSEIFIGVFKLIKARRAFGDHAAVRASYLELGD
ncbi:MAG: hypothetical protein VW771_05800, partial [Gammaproteobacteria bacterium]